MRRTTTPRVALTPTVGRRAISHFRVVEHVVPAQHTRHWPRGTEIGYDNALKLAVKQYIPKLNPDPRPGDITFIAAHANGFPKELYEPLFDELSEKLDESGRRIRAVWIADLVHQGQSGVLNEAALGNDPNWWDFARDLLFLINQKQTDMPQPLVGIGHSMGGSQLAQLALLHPRLLQALILIDPVIQTENPSKAFAMASTYRRDLWPCRAEAARRFADTAFYQSWDARVLDLWVQYGLRDVPTPLYPDPGHGTDPPVTLKTPKAQEVFSYLRPKYYGPPGVSPPADRTVYGDMHPDDIEEDYSFYRPEPAEIFRRLPELKPPVLYIFGRDSDLATPALRRKKMESTGTGIGGSGGRREGRVREAVLNCGHLVPMEKVTACAAAAASFTATEMAHWEQTTCEWQTAWSRKCAQDRVALDEEWRQRLGPRPRRA